MKSNKQLTTEDVAAMFSVKAESVRGALSRKGHYYGIKPHKLPNGRLVWSADEVQKALGSTKN